MGEETGCRAGRCVANNMGSKAVVDALPPPILALFTPRPPIMHLKYPPERKCRSYDGMAQFTNQFEDPSETPPKPPPLETKEQKKKRKQDEAIARGKTKLDEMKAKWDPKEKHKDGDAYKTLFVGRLSYDATEKDVLREFENYGPVKSCTMVKDDKGKPRGYCFIEFERERDMRNAFKQADGRKINGRRVVVDVERGRTVNNWLPRKLGGGLGGTRKGGKEVNETFSGRAGGGPSGGGGGGGYDSRRDSYRDDRRDSYRDDRRYHDRDDDRRRDDRRDRDRDRSRGRDRDRSRGRDDRRDSRRY